MPTATLSAAHHASGKTLFEQSEAATGELLGKVLPRAYKDGMAFIHGEVNERTLMVAIQESMPQITELRHRGLVAGAVKAHAVNQHALLVSFLIQEMRRLWKIDITLP